MGLTAELSPSSRGFDRCAALLPGAGSHYIHEPQLDKNYNGPSFLKSEGFWMEGSRFLDRESDLPKDFYSSKYFTDKLLQYLEDRKSVV